MKKKYIAINWSAGNDMVYYLDGSISFSEVEDAFYRQHHGRVNIYHVS